MSKIPDRLEALEEKMFDNYEKNQGPKRTYLGGSEIGEECERALWYSYRHAVDIKIPGRILKLFETGHLEELRTIKDLRDTGFTVLDINPDTKDQFEVSAFDGRLKGHFDGAIDGVPGISSEWHLLEIKTSNEKGIKALRKHGVKKSKPKYYGQMQLYMGLGKLKRALFVAKNKNDEKYYFERVKFDPKYFKLLMEKAERVLESNLLPVRISKKEDSFGCRFCDYKKLCWGHEFPAVNCRTCITTKVGDSCKLCEDYNSHIYSPELIKPIALESDIGEGAIEYTSMTGIVFVNCEEGGFIGSDALSYSSLQLSEMNPEDV